MTKRSRLPHSWRVSAALCDWLELAGLLAAEAGPCVARIAAGPEGLRDYLARRFPRESVTALETALIEPGPAGRYDGLISLEPVLGLPRLREALRRLSSLGAPWMVHAVTLEPAVLGRELPQVTAWLRELGYPEVHYRPVEIESGSAELELSPGATERYFLLARRSLVSPRRPA